MRACMRVFLLLAFAASAPVFCYSEQPADDEIETNERLLERWKSDPEHYARLQSDLRAFWQLPPDRQEHLRQLDQQLHETDSITQKRLWSVLERYSAWFDRLPEADQRHIDKTTDRGERLNLVKQLREEQWLKRQPRKDREYLASLPEAQRHDKIAELREEDRRRVTLWMRTLRAREGVPPSHSPKPVRPTDFPADTQLYLKEVLQTQLSHDESDHLKSLEGKWPYYLRTIVDFADKHPVKLPGPATGPTSHDTLRKDYRDALPVQKDLLKSQRTALDAGKGKWPDYAIAVTEIVRTRKPELTPLGPSKAAEFAGPVKQFLDTTLPAKLTAAEKDELKKVEGKWPEYPTKALELATKHGLEVPLMRLPGAEEWRDKVGGALPEVPDHTLREFALNDLTSEERSKLQLSANDPLSRDRLVQEYFKKNPHEKQRLEHLDHQMLLHGGKWPPKKPAHLNPSRKRKRRLSPPVFRSTGDG